MKRALAMTLGAIMVAGSAAPAAAASHIDFSGYYRTHYMIQGNPMYLNDQESFTDSFFADRLNLDITFTPTDEIAVYWRIRSPHRERWGAGASTLTTRHIYGEIKQDWGTVYVGRLHEDFDSWGLTNLGWMASMGFWSVLDPFGDASPLDGIRYVNRWDNGLQLMAQYSRLDEDSKVWDTGGTHYRDSDFSRDRFQVELAYFWDGGGASLGGIYERNAIGSYNKTDPGNPVYRPVNANNAWYINPAIMHSWGDFSVHFEGKAGWSTQDADGSTYTEDVEGEGYAAYLDFNYNYGPGNVTLAGWWVSGVEYTDKDRAIVGIGGDFYPLVAAYGGNAGVSGNLDSYGNDTNRGIDTVVGRANSASIAGSSNNDPLANHWGVVLGGQHSFTDSVTMGLTLGYLALNEETYKDQDKEIGFEADLAFDIKLLDNLSFNTTFGYLVAGDALKTEAQPNIDPEDTYVWVNTLQFNF